jgi:hypothetical protein
MVTPRKNNNSLSIDPSLASVSDDEDSDDNDGYETSEDFESNTFVDQTASFYSKLEEKRSDFDSENAPVASIGGIFEWKRLQTENETLKFQNLKLIKIRDNWK